MCKRLIVFASFLVLLTQNVLLAQEKQRKAYRPDIPGSFLLDFGFNSGLNKPDGFNQGFWGSRTLNLYYHYPVRIMDSKFSYNPGAGFAFERFKLTNNFTLYQQPSSDGTVLLADASQSTALNGARIRKSMVITNYFDIMPVEFRFDTNPKDVSRGMSFTIGGRLGFLLDTHTKINYTLNGVTGTYKDKTQHGINPIRYGAYTRIGFGNFNIFWFYNFSTYFDTNKGPHSSATNATPTNMNIQTIGISLDAF